MAIVFNEVPQPAGTTEPSTGRDTKGLRFPKQDSLAVDLAIQDLEGDLMADQMASGLVP